VEDTRRHRHHPTVDPIPQRVRPEKAERDCHARHRAKDSLVRVGHARTSTTDVACAFGGWSGRQRGT
jgi:hypothetical protein